MVGADLAPASMDAVLCLSLTKWVHLNQGDAGLQARLWAISIYLEQPLAQLELGKDAIATT